MSKNKFLILTYISYICGISAVVGIFYFILCAQYFNVIAKEPLHISLIVLFSFSIIYIASFFIWGAKTKMGKKYWKMYNKWQRDKINKQSIDEIKGTEYYETLPEYSGSNKFNVKGWRANRLLFAFGAPLLLMMVSFFLYSFIRGELSSSDMALPIIVATTITALHIVAIKQRHFIVIDEDGARIVDNSDNEIRFIPWEKIQTVGISVTPDGRRIEWGYMYFTTKQVKTDRVIINYFEKPYVVMLKYRPKVAHCALKYCNKDIKNLDAMKSWKRYIDKL